MSRTLSTNVASRTWTSTQLSSAGSSGSRPSAFGMRNKVKASAMAWRIGQAFHRLRPMTFAVSAHSPNTVATRGRPSPACGHALGGVCDRSDGLARTLPGWRRVAAPAGGGRANAGRRCKRPSRRETSVPRKCAPWTATAPADRRFGDGGHVDVFATQVPAVRYLDLGRRGFRGGMRRPHVSTGAKPFGCLRPRPARLARPSYLCPGSRLGGESGFLEPSPPSIREKISHLSTQFWA